jgi:hypothetical protein
MTNSKILITDLEHASTATELEVLAAINAEVEWAKCRTEKDVIEAVLSSPNLRKRPGEGE